jgi:oligoribonuclease
VSSKPKFLFLDLETTGLSPKTCCVLEIAATITDEKLEEIATFDRLLLPHDVEHISPEVREMHTKNNLWRDVFADGGKQWGVWEGFKDWLTAESKGEKLQLAGSSVHFDRSFLPPRIVELLSHRMLDLRTARSLLEIAGRGDLLPKPETTVAHRARADIDFDLRQAREFAHLLARVNP